MVANDGGCVDWLWQDRCYSIPASAAGSERHGLHTKCLIASRSRIV